MIPLSNITAHLDASLPVIQRKDEIIATIAQHQVVVLAGETGSGKTTQLPKLAMLAGCGKLGRIALTQPRRLAARAVANRLAEELNTSVGQGVGVKIRFHQQVADNTVIKVLTDGMLLAEIQQNALLTEYDTIIVDEAHERSLNIDFLLGYLRQLKDKRPDLKIIVTSATIDLERFSEFFDGAPIISVTGRTYPVEVRYRPLTDLSNDEDSSDDLDMNTAIVRAVEELTDSDPFGDILVFLAGESDIRDATEALRLAGLKHTDILPLYARQSYHDQQKIFTTGGQRRIVLSTNVAETSLTVPGIRHVIDTGVARIKHYSPRNKVQRLPIEAISQASANQRKGRCGRVAEGICIRLYGEEDFLGRPAFTEAEMQRSNLASVILQMQSLGFGQLEHFPLIDPPPSRLITDGQRLLEELQAVNRDDEHLTPIGKLLAKLPIDPRLGRMLIAGRDNHVLAEVCVLAGVLSLQDPRETPADKQEAARQKHKLFEDGRSDFLTLLKLWHRYEYQRKHLSHNKLKTWCQKHFLSARRLKEWHELVAQLHQSMAEMNWKIDPLVPMELPETESDDKEHPDHSDSALIANEIVEPLHRSLLTGMIGQIAQWDERTKFYQGARQVQLVVHPSSVLRKTRARWIMAFEWVETSRTFARLVAEIDVAWLEPIAGHLIKRQYHEPYWSRKQGRVMAKETLSLYGLAIVADRPADFGKVDPETARTVFIREALVNGEVNARWEFLQKNQALMEEAQSWEDKTRRVDVLVDDHALIDFYAQRIPERMCRVVDMDRWLKFKPERHHLLTMSKADVFRKEMADEGAFPEQLQLPNRLKLNLAYQFTPGEKGDGLNVSVTLAQLPLLNQDSLARLVPGILPQKIEAIIRALPKPLRVRLQPAVGQAEQAAKTVIALPSQPFAQCLAQTLSKQAGTLITPEDWASLKLPPHLQANIQVINDKKKVLAESRNLEELQERFAQESRLALRERSAGQEKQAVLDKSQGEWLWAEIPIKKKIAGGGEAFLALVLQDDGVLLSPLPSESEAQAEQAKAVRWLLKIALTETLKGLRKELSKQSGKQPHLCLPWARWKRNCDDLIEQIIEQSIQTLTPQAQAVRSAQAFTEITAMVKPKITAQVRQFASQTQAFLTQGQQLLADCDRLTTPTRAKSIAQIRDFIESLLHARCVIDMSESGWKDLPRYLKAVSYRLEKLTENLPLDEKRQQEYAEVEKLLKQADKLRATNPIAYQQAQTMAIELWVMTFAQPHALKGVASVKRMQGVVNGV